MEFIKREPKIGDLFYTNLCDLGILKFVKLFNIENSLPDSTPTLNDLEIVKKSFYIDNNYIIKNYNDIDKYIVLLKYVGNGMFVELYSGLGVVLITNKKYNGDTKFSEEYSLKAKTDKIVDSNSLMSLISAIYKSPFCVSKLISFDLPRDDDILFKFSKQDDAYPKSVIEQMYSNERASLKCRLEQLGKYDEDFAYGEKLVRDFTQLEDKPVMLEKKTDNKE